MTVPPTSSGEGDPGQVTRIAEEFIRLHEAGQLTDLDEFCARYPEDQRANVRQECEQLLRIQGVIKQPDRLTSGQTLGSYEIVEPIGKGGMGEVYRAKDPELDRDIAIKVLPPELACQPERVKRFKREAKAIAALDHPNIVTIHTVEESDGLHFITMQLVQGKTLSELIPKKGLSLEKFFDLAIPLADAISSAHDQGITHRDLKPANIMVTADGRVEILDFGLAKLKPRVIADGPTQMPMSSLTVVGQIVGTVAYMSPEQAEGRDVDHRTDIFSLGIILYEMATGQRPFKGESRVALMSSIMKDTPTSVRELSPQVPNHLGRVIRRSLEKDPESRFQVAKDLRNELAGLKQEVSSGEIETDTAPARSKRDAAAWIMAWVLAGLLIGALLGGIVGYQSQADTLPLRLRKERFPAALLRNNQNHAVSAVSPDGGSVAFVQNERLWIRDLDRVDAREVPNTEGATWPFWSSDSERIGYFVPRTRELQTVDVRGESKQIPARFPSTEFSGATWGSEGTIVFSRGTKGLFEVAETGGDPTLLLGPDRSKGEVFLQFPFALPEGRGFLVTVGYEDYRFRVFLWSGQEYTLLREFDEDTHVTYSLTGHLLYHFPSGQPGIWALPISIVDGSFIGTPFKIHEDGSCPSVSTDGTLVYSSLALERLVWVNRSGTVEETIGQPQNQIRHPDVSPDGLLVAVSAMENGNRDIWVHDSSKGTKNRVTFHAAEDFQSTWSPGGDRLTFSSRRSGLGDLFEKAADGSGEAEPVETTALAEFEPFWSSDGEYLVYLTFDAGAVDAPRSISYKRLTGNEQPRPLFPSTSFDFLLPSLSPNGRFVAYMSDRNGSFEIRVSRFPDGDGEKGPISGMHPIWGPDGKELFFVDPRGLWVVECNTDDEEFQWGEPQMLFTEEQVGAELYDWSALPVNVRYDVAPGGEGFVVVQSEGTSFITVVQNWIVEFEDR